MWAPRPESSSRHTLSGSEFVSPRASSVRPLPPPRRRLSVSTSARRAHAASRSSRSAQCRQLSEDRSGPQALRPRGLCPCRQPPHLSGEVLCVAGVVCGGVRHTCTRARACLPQARAFSPPGQGESLVRAACRTQVGLETSSTRHGAGPRLQRSSSAEGHRPVGRQETAPIWALGSPAGRESAEAGH